MTPWLTPAALLDLTGRKRWSAQARQLRALGIRYILSAEGRPLVEHGAVLTSKPAAAPREPDWSKLGNAA